MTFTVTIKNYEGSGTGGDGGAGVGVRYYLNGQQHDVAVPNNGELTFQCDLGNDGYICEVYARPVYGEYEDKWVDVIAYDENGIYEFPSVHIGDNTSDAVLSYTYTVDNAEATYEAPETANFTIDANVTTFNNVRNVMWFELTFRNHKTAYPTVDENGNTAPRPQVEWTQTISKDGATISTLSSTDQIAIENDGQFWGIGSVGFSASNDNTSYWTIDGISVDGMNWENLEPGNYEITVQCKIKHHQTLNLWNVYTWTGTFNVPDTSSSSTGVSSTSDIRITFEGKLNITPVCTCYLNSDAPEKQITFTYSTSAQITNIYSDHPVMDYIIQQLYSNTTYRIELYDENAQLVATFPVSIGSGTFDYTFTLPENTKKKYTFKFYAKCKGIDYLLDSKQVIIERQEYCHEVIVEAKLYDATGEETDVIIHPTSADYDPAKHGSYTVKLFTKNEQGTLTNMTEVIANWQYDISNSSTGIYEFTIPNTDTNCLNLGYYAVSFKITPPNGYYNRYNIEATDIVINSNRIEKVGFWNDTMNITYKNGVAILDNIYEKVSGIFANPLLEFSVAMQENTTTESKMYSFCSRIYNSPITLNLPTYTETEMTELAKTIVKELGQPRKIETYQILPKELPHLNQVINVIYSNEIRTFPIYSIELSLSNSNKIVKVKNNPSKLLKDYLSMIK